MPTTAASRKSNSWRTSASRRSRQHPTSTNTTNTNGIDNSTYKLNPYKNNRVTTTINNKGKGGKLRNSGGNSNNPQVVRGVIIDDDDELHNDINGIVDSKKEDINLLNDILNSDDDDLGLDNILSSISDVKSIISNNNIDGVTDNNIQPLDNVKQQDNKEADSNNIISTTDNILPLSVQQPPTIATNNNNSNNNNNNIRLPSNNSRHDINRLSDTTPPIQNASSNISSGNTQSNSPQIVSNISSRALDFDIENDIILPTASHNITQDVSNTAAALFPIPIRNDVKNNSELLDGSDKRVPSLENIIPHGKFF